tara:strand:+ start:2097 stop:2228 length:132 start_codon:yes stop_codon:yes gene_type:complete
MTNFKIAKNFNIDPTDYDVGSFAFGTNKLNYQAKVCYEKGILF